jgi:hypothetical protein
LRKRASRPLGRITLVSLLRFNLLDMPGFSAGHSCSCVAEAVKHSEESCTKCIRLTNKIIYHQNQLLLVSCRTLLFLLRNTIDHAMSQAPPALVKRVFLPHFTLSAAGHSSSCVAEAVKYSEESRTKCIGLTIETRPDYCLGPHLRDMLNYGCTRIEMGVQVRTVTH